ncbi:MAG: DUF935 domain-containing protein, partial [Gammaproteobacteria bacterium]|nr:DUF935 domain-containing protein [Gammaproteobacteria bacterium]
MKEVKLPDHRGLPIQRKKLSGEAAAPGLTGVRTIWRESVADDLTPDRLAAIFRNAVDGDANAYLTPAEEMEERDPHYRSVLSTRKLAIAGPDPTVEPASDDAHDVKLADETRNMIRKPAFGAMLYDVVDALGKGFSVTEIDWSHGREWMPTYKWRDPRFFMFDRITGCEVRLLDENGGMDGLELEPYKFIVHMPQLKSGVPVRNGLARRAAFSYMCKTFSVKTWRAFAEIYGLPIRPGRYGPNPKDDDLAVLRQAVANIGTDAAAIMPDSMKIEFQQLANTTGGPELFQRLVEWFDKQISKAVLGQTMTADDGSSQSQAQVHDGVRVDILRADAKSLSETLNRDLVQPFIDLNFGAQENYPRILFPIPKPEDLKLLTDALAKLVPLGLRVAQHEVRAKFRLSEPGPKDEVFTAPVAAALPDMNRAVNRQEPEKKDTADLYADQVSDAMQTVTDGLPGPVKKL